MAVQVEGSSATRAMFEEGRRLAKKYGAENVYDFSLGNPSVAPPRNVQDAMLDVINKTDFVKLHGYMNNSGHEDVREAVAKSLNKKFETSFSQRNIIMTVGAAGGLNVILKAIIDPGDEVIAFAPYFGEYNSYVANFDGKVVAVSPSIPDFQPNFDDFLSKITSRTKAVIINTPNNPTGVAYSEETIKRLAKILYEKQDEFGTQIYLISDEPYRELVYDGFEAPFVAKYYKNTIVAYSFSKSLSLPGERIGYLAIPSEADDFENLAAAANVANRILGFVNAPSIMQLTIARCLDVPANVAAYDANRKILYDGLTSLGFECTKPMGAFYLWVKSMEDDDREFARKAKQFNILVVPGSSFMCKGYVRIAYCVETDMIKKSFASFEKLAALYK